LIAMKSFEIASPAFKGEFQTNVSPARLVLTSTGATPTHEDQTQLFDFLTRIVQSQVAFVAVYDLRVFGMPSPSLLRSLGEWCKKNEREFQPLNLAIAIVLKNNLWSGALKKFIGVVTAICPPVCPLLMTYSLESVEGFFVENCGTMESAATVRVTSRFPSIESCEVEVEEEPSQPRAPCSMPKFSLLMQPFSFSATGDTCWISANTSLVKDQHDASAVMVTKDSRLESDDCSTFADTACLLDFAECSSDVSSVRHYVSGTCGGEAHRVSQFRSALQSPKNKTGCFPHRVRKVLTKSR